MPDVVHQWPQYPGGSNAFMKWLEQLGKEMVAYMPAGMNQTYVQVGFVVDKDGVPVNFNDLHGFNNEEFYDELISRMENMPKWPSAMLNDKSVAKKMEQTVILDVH